MMETKHVAFALYFGNRGFLHEIRGAGIAKLETLQDVLEYKFKSL